MKLHQILSDLHHWFTRPRSTYAIQAPSYCIDCDNHHMTSTVKILTEHLLELDDITHLQATFKYYNARTVEYTDQRMHPVAREIEQDNEEKCIYTENEAAPLAVLKNSEEVYVKLPSDCRVWSLKLNRSPKGWLLKIKLSKQVDSKNDKDFIKYLSDLLRALNFTH